MQRNVTITTDVTVTMPVVLQVGDVTETVTVEAKAGLVETRSGSLGQVVTQQKIVELPLNGRNAATLVLLAPGTADWERETRAARAIPLKRGLSGRPSDHLQRLPQRGRQLLHGRRQQSGSLDQRQ